MAAFPAHPGVEQGRGAESRPGEPDRAVRRYLRHRRGAGADLRRHHGHGGVLLSDADPVRGGHARPAPAAGDPVLDPFSHRLGHAGGGEPAGAGGDGPGGPAGRPGFDTGPADVVRGGHPAGPDLPGPGDPVRHGHRVAAGGAGAVRRRQLPGGSADLAGPAAGGASAGRLHHAGRPARRYPVADAGVSADLRPGPERSQLFAVSHRQAARELHTERRLRQRPGPPGLADPADLHRRGPGADGPVPAAVRPAEKRAVRRCGGLFLDAAGVPAGRGAGRRSAPGYAAVYPGVRGPQRRLQPRPSVRVYGRDGHRVLSGGGHAGGQDPAGAAQAPARRGGDGPGAGAAVRGPAGGRFRLHRPDAPGGGCGPGPGILPGHQLYPGGPPVPGDPGKGPGGAGGESRRRCELPEDL